MAKFIINQRKQHIIDCTEKGLKIVMDKENYKTINQKIKTIFDLIVEYAPTLKKDMIKDLVFELDTLENERTLIEINEIAQLIYDTKKENKSLLHK